MTDVNRGKIAVRVNVVAADSESASVMALSAEANKISSSVSRAGYEIKGVYTGERGVSPFDVIMEISNTLYIHKEFINNLVLLAMPIVQYISSSFQRKEKESEKNDTVIVFIIGDIRKPVTITKDVTNEKILGILLEVEPELSGKDIESLLVAMDVIIPR